MAIAGGIAAALFQRERTGVAPTVDVSLLGLAMWVLSPDIVASGLYGGDPMPKFDHYSSPNPLVGGYKTKDDRFVTLMLLQSDRFWPELCEPRRSARPDRRRALRRRRRPVHQPPRAASTTLDEIFASAHARRVEGRAPDDDGRVGAGADGERAGRRSAGPGQRLPAAGRQGRRRRRSTWWPARCSSTRRSCRSSRRPSTASTPRRSSSSSASSGTRSRGAKTAELEAASCR